jgi:hypothetical protein
MAEKWTKISLPFSCLMNPNPFALLNHFTVPCSIYRFSFAMLRFKENDRGFLGVPPEPIATENREAPASLCDLAPTESTCHLFVFRIALLLAPVNGTGGSKNWN